MLIVRLEPGLKISLLGHQGPKEAGTLLLSLMPSRPSPLSLLHNLLKEHQILTEELMTELPLINHPLRPATHNALNPRQQPHHRLILKQHPARKQLGQDTARTPNIDLLVVFDSDDDFRGAVGAGLKVEG